MKKWIHRVVATVALMLAAYALRAEPAVGMSKDEVLVGYGEPQSSISVGDREILTYDAGKVVFRNGRVISCDFSTHAGVAAAPKASVTVARKPAGGWYTDFDLAKTEAKTSRRRILALFTGSTWCPACIRFEREVAHDSKFLEFAQKKFVLVKLDFPRGGLPPGSKNQVLAERYQIGGFPTVITMNAEGKDVSQVDVMSALNKGERVPEEMLAAIGAGGAGKSKSGTIVMFLVGFALIVWWLKK